MTKSFPAVAVASLTCRGTGGTFHVRRLHHRVLPEAEECFSTFTVTYADSARFPFRTVSTETLR